MSQVRKLRENNRELDCLRREERKPESLESSTVNTNIDMSSVERALQDIEEQELERYREFSEQEIKEAENTIEMLDILNLIDNMSEGERDEFFNGVPDCLQTKYCFYSDDDENF